MTQPETDQEEIGVPQRSRYEKTRGLAWMFGSLIMALVIIAGIVTIVAWFGMSREVGLAAVAVLSTDALVFRWGIRKFDITPPKAFREAQENA